MKVFEEGTEGRTPSPVRRSAGGRIIRKIPPDRRRRPLRFSLEPVRWKRLLWKLKEDSQFQRTVVQSAFVLLCLWIGLEFHLFMRWGLSGGREAFVNRPPGVEGFLPISALISLTYWFRTGIVN